MRSTFSRIAVVALTIWLGLAAGAANAVTFITAFGGSDSKGWSAAFVDSQVNGSFTDLFNFSLPGASTTGTANVISLGGGGVSLSQFNLYEVCPLCSGGLFQIGTGSTGLISINPATMSFTGGGVPNAYELKVQGYTTSDLTGSYAGNINIAAIPEPEIYAMMLVGLGLLGFSARHRNENT